MTYTRLYTGDDGDSRWEDVDLPFTLTDFAPPAPPLAVSVAQIATGLMFVTFPAGWRGDWHPAPRRQFQFFLAGIVGAESGDGETRQFGPGDAVLVEDTTGRGHRSWVAGDTDVVMAVVRLPDLPD
ncbi:MAG: cupin domain-containing protein [Chloroflexia bacterium]|nr:cupin domain-containing protein [Chloroflexia bacterium]